MGSCLTRHFTFIMYRQISGRRRGHATTALAAPAPAVYAANWTAAAPTLHPNLTFLHASPTLAHMFADADRR